MAFLAAAVLALALIAGRWTQERLPEPGGARSVRVPRVDTRAPEAFVAAEGRTASSLGRPLRMRLDRPALVVTAAGRDPGGVVRVRVSVEEHFRCRDASGRARSARRQRYFPPPSFARIRVPPGAVIPDRRSRRVALRFLPGPCAPVDRVTGRVWSDVTDAKEREASAEIRFSWSR